MVNSNNEQPKMEKWQTKTEKSTGVMPGREAIMILCSDVLIISNVDDNVFDDTTFDDDIFGDRMGIRFSENEWNVLLPRSHTQHTQRTHNAYTT